jgi:hypothetical protein
MRRTKIPVTGELMIYIIIDMDDMNIIHLHDPSRWNPCPSPVWTWILGLRKLDVYNKQARPRTSNARRGVCTPTRAYLGPPTPRGNLSNAKDL